MKILSKRLFKVYLSIIVFFLFPIQSNLLFAQNNPIQQGIDFQTLYSNYTRLLSPEKLYLHTDKTQYSVGDTIWFKGYLLNNSLNSEFVESNFLYVELIIYPFAKDPISGEAKEEGRLLKRIKVKRRDGVLQGHIPLTDDCITGGAILRGYTYWNLNQPIEYISYKNITILNPIKDQFVEKLKEKKERTPEVYLDMGVQNPFKERDKKRDISCVFLPESGRYLVGERGSIGIKAIDETGLGISVTGSIHNKAGEEITNFTTNEYGFSKIYLTPTSTEEVYTAKIKDGRNVEKIVKLPKPESNGAVINLQWRGTNIVSHTTVSSNFNADSLRYLLCNGTEVFYDEPVSKVMRLSIPIEKLAVGINNALVVDNRGNILSKRPFFVFPSKMDSAKFITDKEKYNNRELVRVNVNLSRPVAGDFSISVTDNELAPYDIGSSNILTHMLLGSELKGYVENPQQYFNQEIPLAERVENLDMLLITQGWEYYDLPKILKGEYDNPKYGREYLQSVAGQVKRSIFKKKKESVISFIAPKINFAAMGDLDEEGYFELKDVDFPDSTQFIVNATDANGKGKKSFYPTIFDDTFAGEVDYLRPSKQKIKYTPEVAEVLTRKYYNDGGTQSYTLNTVTIYGKKRTMPDISPISNYLFRPSQVREKKDMFAYEKHGYDLISYIADVFHLRYIYNKETGQRILLSRAIQPGTRMGGGTMGGSAVYAFINGMEVSPEDLEGYSLDEVEKVAYVAPHEAGAFVGLFPGASYAGLIMVKTKLRTISYKPRNISNGTPLGWQKPKHFYSPQYDIKEKNIVDTGIDSRSTLYWNPNIKTDETGSCSFKFNTSDRNVDYTVVIEGITCDGEYIFTKQKIRATNTPQ